MRGWDEMGAGVDGGRGWVCRGMRMVEVGSK